MPLKVVARLSLVVALLTASGCALLWSSAWQRPPLLDAGNEVVYLDSLIAAFGMSGVRDRDVSLRADGSCCLTKDSYTSSDSLTNVRLGRGDSKRFDTVLITANGQRVLRVSRERVSGEDETWWNDEKGWIDYYRSRFPESVVFPLPNASLDVSLAYLALLGHGLWLWSEYGWICEYGTVGMPPQQRSATLTLLDEGRVDLLQDVLRQGVPEGRLYAADALLYVAHRGRRLSDEDRQVIDQLRASPDSVRTCVGGMGSYKTRETSIGALLSSESVAELPDLYALLKAYGHYQGGI